MKVVTKMNREQTEEYFIKDLIAKTNKVVTEVTALKDFLINFQEWKYPSSEETHQSDPTANLEDKK